MSDNKRKKMKSMQDESDSGGDTGQGGGQKGGIGFVDFIGTGGGSRDDTLPIDEKRRLLSQHQDIHETRVKKQKALRDERAALKDGKLSLDTFRYGSGAQSQYKANPILADKAQFSGIDRQINSLPTENIAETNQEKRDELDYQYRLRHMPENAPRFNPKPQFNR